MSSSIRLLSVAQSTLHVAVASIAIFLGGVPCQSASTPPVWVSVGLYGGEVEDIAIFPASPEIMLAGIGSVGLGSSTDSLYRSQDGGLQWQPIGAFGAIYDFEIGSTGVAYFGSASGLWRSFDQGLTWGRLDLGIPEPQQIYTIRSIAGSSKQLWAGLSDASGDPHQTLMRSSDGGVTWENRTPPLIEPMGCRALLFDAADSSRLYGAFDASQLGSQIWFSDDDGGTWTRRDLGMTATVIYDLVDDGARVLAAGAGGLYSTGDSGLSWTRFPTFDWPTQGLRGLALDPLDPAKIYLASRSDGLFRSLDGGLTWEFGVGETQHYPLRSILFSPADPQVIYLGADPLGVLTSHDGGASFSATVEGIANLFPSRIDDRPSRPRQLVASVPEGGVALSGDSGRSWSFEMLPTTWINRTRFAADGLIYALATDDVYRRDAVGTWIRLGLPSALSRSGRGEIEFGKYDPSLVVLGSANSSQRAVIWRSSDGGETFTEVHMAEMRSEIYDLEIVDDGTDQVMLATVTTHNSQFDRQGAVLRSTDGGQTWSRVFFGLPTEFEPYTMCSSPKDPLTVFLVQLRLNDLVPVLFKSLNGGVSWASTGFEGRNLLDVQCDPRTAGVIYLSGVFQMLRSTDSGATFKLFESGLPDRFVGFSVEFVGFPNAPRLLTTGPATPFSRSFPVPIFADGFETGNTSAWSSSTQ